MAANASYQLTLLRPSEAIPTRRPPDPILSYASSVTGTLDGADLQDHLSMTVSHTAMRVPAAANENKKHYDAFTRRIAQNAEWQALTQPAEPADHVDPDTAPALTLGQRRTLVALRDMTDYLDEVMHTPGLKATMDLSALKSLVAYVGAAEALKFTDVQANPAQIINPLAFHHLARVLDRAVLPTTKPQPTGMASQFADNAAALTMPPRVPLSQQLQEDLVAIARSTDFNPQLVHQAQMLHDHTTASLGSGAAQPPLAMPPGGSNEDAVLGLIAQAKEEKAVQNGDHLQRAIDADVDTRLLDVVYFCGATKLNYRPTIQGTTITVTAQNGFDANAVSLTGKPVQADGLVREAVAQRLATIEASVAESVPDAAQRAGVTVDLANADGVNTRTNIALTDFNRNSVNLTDVGAVSADQINAAWQHNPDLKAMGLRVSM